MREDIDELREEFRDRPPRLRRCFNAMCGALDCPACHPTTAHLDAIEDTEDEEQSEP